MPFHFRQFSVEDEQSSMRTGTDAVLLGAWTDPGLAMSILDIGTGSGLIAMMLAQKCEAVIDAIDPDVPSYEQCKCNFRNCPWSHRLTAILGRIQNYRDKKYQLIVSNPPYFRNSLRASRAGRSNARHNDELTFEELLEAAEQLLTPDGKFTVILPASELKTITGIAARQLLFCHRILEIIPKPGREPLRVLMEFRRMQGKHVTAGQLTLRNEHNAFTPEYRELTKDYYMDLP